MNPLHLAGRGAEMSRTAVLVVDDDLDHAELVCRTLERHHASFAVTHVADGPACLDALAKNRYAVILLDYSLPRMTGLQVLARIRELGHTEPVVLATAQGDERIAAQALEAGAIDYVVKTAGYFTALPAVVKKVLKQHELAFENSRLLAESEAQRARLAQILDSTSDGFLLLDEAARILAANRRAGDLLGFAPDKALGRELAQLLADHREADPAAGQLEALLGRMEGGGQGDLALAVPRRTLNWSGQPTRDAAGTTLGLTLTLRDVTQEREVDRLKSDFVSFVTHQLRTPLSGIKWMLELARQEPEAPPIADYVDEAASAAERLIKMVNDLIDITRLESGKVTPRGTVADLWELTSSLRDDFKVALSEKDLRLTTSGDAEVPCVAADPALLHQAILNLISNAVKYTPAGGTIDIGIERDGAEVRWKIRDSGIGIPQACQARLFQKFYRADNVYAIETEGTGLGLYLVRLIAEHFRGRVDCQSEEGAGSVFSITLPQKASP